MEETGRLEPFQPKGRGPQSKYWVFTSFDEREPEYDAATMDYMVYQREECPSTGRLHWQGYVALKTRNYRTAVQTACHCKCYSKPAMGNEGQAAEYCKKEFKYKKDKQGKDTDVVESRRAPGGHPIEHGEFDGNRNTRGRRTDIHELVELVKEGKSDYDICSTDPESFSKYHKHIKVIRTQLLRPSVEREVRVIVLYGTTGVGKSHRMWHKYGYDLFATNLMGRDPFQDYDGQKVLFIDEFHPDQIPLEKLNVYLDVWPCKVDCRYHNPWAMWNVVVIASNVPVEKWYMGRDAKQLDALRRRIHQVIEVTSRDQQIDLP